jgi:DNA-binding transcriptional MerR regulator/methylmalonyl-CoA mutase cobalamin-binding subunit
MDMNAKDEDTTAAMRFPIGVVARRTGLSKDVLRVWESRYGVVRPVRSDSGRRLYSEEDVERLSLLRAATSVGWSISEVADRTMDELRELATPASPPVLPPSAAHKGVEAPTEIVQECRLATEDMSGERLEAALSRGLMGLSGADFINGVVAPLLAEIGELWRMGRLDPAQEHLVSVTVRTVLARMISAMQPGEGSSRIVLSTLAGEDHELGAMLAAATAAAAGWQAIFIGANLPVADIAAAVRRTGARAVGLSVVASNGTTSHATVSEQLTSLRRELAKDVQIFVGGAAAAKYEGMASAIGARQFGNLDEFRVALQVMDGGGS